MSFSVFLSLENMSPDFVVNLSQGSQIRGQQFCGRLFRVLKDSSLLFSILLGRFGHFFLRFLLYFQGLQELRLSRLGQLIVGEVIVPHGVINAVAFVLKRYFLIRFGFWDGQFWINGLRRARLDRGGG